MWFLAMAAVSVAVLGIVIGLASLAVIYLIRRGLWAELAQQHNIAAIKGDTDKEHAKRVWPLTNALDRSGREAVDALMVVLGSLALIIFFLVLRSS